MRVKTHLRMRGPTPTYANLCQPMPTQNQLKSNSIHQTNSRKISFLNRHFPKKSHFQNGLFPKNLNFESGISEKISISKRTLSKKSQFQNRVPFENLIFKISILDSLENLIFKISILDSLENLILRTRNGCFCNLSAKSQIKKRKIDIRENLKWKSRKWMFWKISIFVPQTKKRLAETSHLFGKSQILFQLLVFFKNLNFRINQTVRQKISISTL